ncbi:MAG: DUF4159 domain-containing protein [Pseudomonadota bacterium]
MLQNIAFASPAILAALALTPLLWFLLRATPPAPKHVQFPPFSILRQLRSKEETPQRTPWPLILLRMAIAILIIVGLAGPILNAPAPSNGASALLLVIDDTWPAAYNWRARREAMREAAAQAEQANQEIFVLTTAPVAQTIPPTPMTGRELRALADSLSPQPLLADRAAAHDAIKAFAADNEAREFDVRWLADGLASPDDKYVSEALNAIGALAVYADSAVAKPVLRGDAQDGDALAFSVERVSVGGRWAGDIVAKAREGRELARARVVLDDGQRAAQSTLELPLALRNDLASVTIENVPAAGARWLADARNRRALVGLVSDNTGAGNNLLSGSHYLREALNPFAEFVEGDIATVLAAGVSVIALDDVGTIREGAARALEEWVARGGMLIRFAGPVVAEAARDETPALMPVALRGGGRAFGGALTWDTPQLLDAFPSDSPFAGLATPSDVFVRQQILAEPGGDTTRKSWARLEDGTPLVTGEARGNGAIALFHVTATPAWSDIPISEVFVSMLRRLVVMSTAALEQSDLSDEARFPALRIMDGYGALQRPTENAPALSVAELSAPPGPDRLPGLYGSPDAPLALNPIHQDAVIQPMRISGVDIRSYVAAPPQALSPPLFAAALLLLLLDGLLALFLSGKLRLRRVRGGTVPASQFGLILFSALAGHLMTAPEAAAQPLDRPIDRVTVDAALTTRLAHVETGDPTVDRLAGAGLGALSRELARRTSLEPGAPVIVNPETDDLSIYPFLYWPIVDGAPAPTEDALANLENFMTLGGLVVFDTRDDERTISNSTTPEAQALRRILARLDIPPLEPVEDGHVLLRSFYLLSGLQGRHQRNPVWVEAETSGSTDSVTALIIGGRDWAGAWATDQFGRPERAMSVGGERARELAYRAGINMVMVAYTGNYKSDQVHAPILLERMGR